VRRRAAGAPGACCAAAPHPRPRAILARMKSPESDRARALPVTGGCIASLVLLLGGCAAPDAASELVRQQDGSSRSGGRSSVVRVAPRDGEPPPFRHPSSAERAAERRDRSSFELGLGLGARLQDSGAWAGADELVQFLALDFALRPPRWPLELTFRVTGATDSDAPAFAEGLSEDVDRTDLSELDFGLRLPVELDGGTRLHVGGGVAWLDAVLSEERDRHRWWRDYDEVDRDGAFGWWAGGGLALPLGAGHALTLDARWSAADADLAGRSVRLDGWSLLVGWSWRHRFP